MRKFPSNIVSRWSNVEHLLRSLFQIRDSICRLNERVHCIFVLILWPNATEVRLQWIESSSDRMQRAKRFVKTNHQNKWKRQMNGKTGLLKLLCKFKCVQNSNHDDGALIIRMFCVDSLKGESQHVTFFTYHENFRQSSFKWLMSNLLKNPKSAPCVWRCSIFWYQTCWIPYIKIKK